MELDDHRRPVRGGQNLTERWRRLERATRGKEARREELDAMPASQGDDVSASTMVRHGRKQERTFHGLVIPEQPKPPADDECCMSGCAICVYDLYDESLEAYNQSIAALQSTLRARGVAESEWPPEIPASNGKFNDEKISSLVKNVALDAFEQLERALAAKNTQGQGTS
ncbi:hypothetical protein PUNSTDRAFT_68000 [Punctularia strigosozonata HHB-11173 SS5]|uniref:uncharacterized protein n=1 Tax=Punctularia strigosozonata (strain HHB-11173) TaxID=741275 RepID=UPI0004417BB4|nr:uncharacterized protein PUNSTDRAFT_68000 [Punctularia strigosozonata HHB-11173 SS5]EIN08801.1 hypothetical protein PUNSTDRAFT_68000 [Punctularia strigosozonata HHB-11173 SS5]